MADSFPFVKLCIDNHPQTHTVPTAQSLILEMSEMCLTGGVLGAPRKCHAANGFLTSIRVLDIAVSVKHTFNVSQEKNDAIVQKWRFIRNPY